MADGPTRRQVGRRAKSVPGSPGFRPGTGALVPVRDDDDEQSQIQSTTNHGTLVLLHTTETTPVDNGTIQGIDANTRVAWVCGGRNHAWQRALRLNDI